MVASRAPKLISEVFVAVLLSTTEMKTMRPFLVLHALPGDNQIFEAGI